ncbi:MAG: hypothetical protein QG654_545 [Patescibacteria group bacterium]|nr:hypothetical protein [Patescibacteria group bacterium]
MKTNFPLLNELITKFIKSRHKVYDYSIKRGDGEKSLSYIAVRVFKGDHKLFSKWLSSNFPAFGTLTALELLEVDRENWVVRDALMKKWLTQERLVVPSPVIPDKYVRSMRNGFLVTVPAEEVDKTK